MTDSDKPPATSGQELPFVHLTPWRVEWDEYAGYDCMSGGWDIRDRHGMLVLTLGAGKNDAAKERQFALALRIVAAVNEA